jgi:hypothetical protein
MTGADRGTGAASDGDPGDPGVHGVPAGTLLRAAVDRIRVDPRLLVPFLLAGLVLSGLGRLRRQGPVPTAAGTVFDSLLTIAVGPYAEPVGGFYTPPSALVGLKLPYLAWTVVGGALGLATVVVAGWATVGRALGDRPLRGLASYAAFVVVVEGAFRLLAVDGEFGPLGIVLILLYLWVLARLFATPVFAVAGDGPLAAVRRSASATAGHGRSLAGLLLLVGLAAGLLGHALVGSLDAPPAVVPLVTAVVAPVHAVAAVEFVERTTPGR